MSEHTPKADPSGIYVDQLEISADGELLGLSDEDLDAIAGGLAMSEPADINRVCDPIKNVACGDDVAM